MDEGTLLDGPRMDLVMEATYELADLAQHIMDLSGPKELVFRGLAARIKELNSAVMAAVGDESDLTTSLRHSLYRNHMEKEPTQQRH